MSGNATLRGSEANFEFCKQNEKTELVKSESFRWFYDQIPSLVPKFKIFFSIDFQNLIFL